MAQQQHRDYEPTEQEAAEIMASIEADAQQTNDQDQQQDIDQDGHQQDPQDEDGQQDRGKSKAARDAAKYRTQLREVEAERDTLADQLTTARRHIADQAIEAAGTGVTPALVWELGTDVAAMFNDDGTLNQQTVTSTVQDIATRYNIHGPNEQPNPAQAHGQPPASNDNEGLLFDPEKVR